MNDYGSFNGALIHKSLSHKQVIRINGFVCTVFYRCHRYQLHIGKKQMMVADSVTEINRAVYGIVKQLKKVESLT